MKEAYVPLLPKLADDVTERQSRGLEYGLKGFWKVNRVCCFQMSECVFISFGMVVLRHVSMVLNTAREIRIRSQRYPTNALRPSRMPVQVAMPCLRISQSLRFRTV